MSIPDPKPHTDNSAPPVPKWMKFRFSPEEHHVWESIFPPAEGNPPPSEGATFTLRRRRPSPLYMSKIVRSLAELGVYPVFRTNMKGELVPWDQFDGEVRPSWRSDWGIRGLLGNLAVGSDPEINIDAYYHPLDLADHFGADPNQWKSWPQGMTGVRPGPARTDVVLTTTLDLSNFEYLRKRNPTRRFRANTALVSSGGVAFFAAAAVDPWPSAGDRARIGRLKTKLAVDFYTIHNHAPLPEDPVIASLEVDTADQSEVSPPPAVPVGAQLQLPINAPTSAPATPTSAATNTERPLSLEEELRLYESRAAQLREEIARRDAHTRYTQAIQAFETAVRSAQVSRVELHTPELTPDCYVPEGIRIMRIVLTLPDGREFQFDEGFPLDEEAAEIDADRAAFEANPVEYTFGG